MLFYVISIFLFLLCGCHAQVEQSPSIAQIYSPRANANSTSANGKVYEVNKPKIFTLSNSDGVPLQQDLPSFPIESNQANFPESYPPIHPLQGDSKPALDNVLIPEYREYENVPTQFSYNSIKTEFPLIAITFDDGPHPELTPRLLDILKQRGIKATFYLIGKNVDAYPEIVRRMVAEGHEVGNHSYNHPALTRLSPTKVAQEVKKTQEAIQRATGIVPRSIRPPYGATNSRLNQRFLEEFGLITILWSVDPLDWKYRNANRIASHILQHTRPGDIILAHDIHPSTLAAMPATLDGLLAKGYRFVTVSELLSFENLNIKQNKKAPASATTP